MVYVADSQLSTTEFFQSPEAASGTIFHTSLCQLRLSLFYESGSKLIFSLVCSRRNWRTAYWHTA